jgi:hypothetical protein
MGFSGYYNIVNDIGKNKERTKGKGDGSDDVYSERT